ncbi:MAG: adenylyltransferase/cytidyltransferase family protein [Proteobacteria bacterium]|nr:adenylyltransferase/cytidyltransferase family protein [Pseudomonadota bacterium]
MPEQPHNLLVITGRFQPFHNDHLQLVQFALGRAARVVIGITNADPAARQAHPTNAHRHLARANPFSYEERKQLIAAALAAAAIPASRYEIVAFPLDEPAAWPAIVPPGAAQIVRVFSDWEREKVRRFESAGYLTVVLEGDLARRISATDIRQALAQDKPWQHWVPPGTRELLANWRCAAVAMAES